MAVAKQPKPAAKRMAAAKPLTMRHLWRLGAWGGTAAIALLFAALASRSETGSQRIEVALASLRGSPPPLAARAFDAKAETQRLSDRIRSLTAENDHLKSRLAAIEQNLDNLTSSIARESRVKQSGARAGAAPEVQPLAQDAAAPATIPASPSVAMAAAAAPVVAPIDRPAAAEPPPAVHAAAPPVAAAAEPPPATPAKTEYGADIGSALSIPVLRARWLGMRSAHRQLFAGLTATAVQRPLAQPGHSELRLVVGPFPSAQAATRLCVALAAYRLFCKPAAFDGQGLALQ